MTLTGYMTEDAWLEMAPKMVEGIRAQPIVCGMPHWWVIKVVDGFGPHVSSVEAMAVYRDANILLIKEEGDTSHVCQAYDQQTAKDDKVTMRQCLTYLRKSEKLSKSVVDGWDLIHVALAAVRELSPNAWISSFKRVNLNPKFRVPFPVWCERISGFLQGGESFKPEKVLADPYTLLPSFWHGMSPVEKKQCAQVLSQHAGAYTAECVLQLHREMHVPLSDMQNLRVCLELAGENPEHLDREAPGTGSTNVLQADVVVSSQAAMRDVADGLASFQLHPTRGGKRLLSGLDLFEHMVKRAARSTSEATALLPSTHLDVECTHEPSSTPPRVTT